MPHLSIDERFVICTRIFQGVSQEEIAIELGRSPSTISREIYRNREPDHRYYPTRAQRKANARQRERPVRRKFDDVELYKQVAEKLELKWSPQQISGWLARSTGQRKISHQTIYNYLWRLPRDHAHRRAMRRRGRHHRKAKPGFLARAAKDRVSIHQRPKVVEQRRRIGDWELDLMTCHRTSGYLITAVERKTGYVLIRKVSSKHSGKVTDGIIKMFERFDRALYKTFTFDNGNEFYYHDKLTRELGVKVYFADPFHSGQRGSNENTNGLIRQYFRKTLDYHLISHWDVQKAQRALNERPRLRLKFQTPAAIFGKHPKIAFRI